MLIIQHKYGRGYESIIMALEIIRNIGAGIIILQQPFIGGWELSHSALNLY